MDVPCIFPRRRERVQAVVPSCAHECLGFVIHREKKSVLTAGYFGLNSRLGPDGTQVTEGENKKDSSRARKLERAWTQP